MVKQKTEAIRLPKRIIFQFKRKARQSKARSVADYLSDKKIIIKKLK